MEKNNNGIVRDFGRHQVYPDNHHHHQHQQQQTRQTYRSWSRVAALFKQGRNVVGPLPTSKPLDCGYFIMED
jgi:hypothetical protein